MRLRAAKAKHVRGLLRVALYFSGVIGVCSLVSIRHARAEFQDQTLVFGRQMLQLAHATNHDVTKVMLNGQSMHIGTSSTEDSPDTVLGRYETYCGANKGPGFGDFNDIAKIDPTKADGPSANIEKRGFVRSQGEGKDGTVICFVKGPKTKASGSEAFETLIKTGELGAVGDLRFVYASKGTNGRTLVLTAWTDATFNLKDMVPEEGQDAPGEDFAEVPRVPNSLRVMSGRAADAPYGVNVYKTSDNAGQTLAFYDREMKAQGWFTYDPEMTEEEHEGQGRAYMKNAVVVSVATSKQPEGNFVAVGLSGVAKQEKAHLK